MQTTFRAMERLRNSQFQYLAKHPQEADRLFAMFTETYPKDCTEHDLSPVEEYNQRIDIIIPLITAWSAAYGRDMFAIEMAMLLTMPITGLENLDIVSAADMFEKILPIVIIFLHSNTYKPQASSSTASGRTTGTASSSSSRKGSRSRRSEGSAAHAEGSYNPRSSRSKAASDESKERDRWRCILTGVASVQGCHILPYTWSTAKTSNALKPLLVTGDRPLRTLLGDAIPSSTMYLHGLLTSDPASLDKAWNMLTLSNDVHACWSKALLGFKYLGRTPEGDSTKFTLQYRWLGKSTAKPKDRITLEMLNDPTKKALVDQLDLGFQDYLTFTRCGRPVTSGSTIDIRIPTKDAEQFKAAIELQWALLKVAALCGAAGDPDMSPDSSDSGSPTGELGHIQDVEEEASVSRHEMEPDDFARQLAQRLEEHSTMTMPMRGRRGRSADWFGSPRGRSEQRVLSRGTSRGRGPYPKRGMHLHRSESPASPVRGFVAPQGIVKVSSPFAQDSETQGDTVHAEAQPGHKLRTRTPSAGTKSH